MATADSSGNTARDGQVTNGRKGRKRRLWVWALAALLVAGLVGGWLWWRTQQRAAATQTTYRTVSVTPAAYDLTVSGPGTLVAAQSVSVGTSVAGTIETLVSVGDEVEAGATLAQLETADLEQAVTEAQLALEQAQAEQASLASTQSDSGNSLADQLSSAGRDVADAERQVVSAQSDLNLAQRLQAVGSGSASELRSAEDTYDAAAAALTAAREAFATLQRSQTLQGDADAQELRNAELAVSQAALTLQRAQDDLASATITAPLAGVVTSISDEDTGSSSETATVIAIQAGTTVSEGQTILTLSNYETVDLVAQIDETQISEVALGQEATVTADALADQTFSGEVSAVSPSAEVEDNIPIFEVTVSIANPDLSLRPGMTAEAEIAVKTLPQTLSVPTAAVQTRGEALVLELEQAGRVVPLPVTVVGSDGLSTVVQVDQTADAGAQAPAASGRATGSSTTGSSTTGSSTTGSSTTGAPSGAGLAALLGSGEAVTVRVPSNQTEATSSNDEGGFGGPGFGGPPGGAPR